VTICLTDLARALPGARLHGAGEARIVDVTHDSRAVRAGAAFVAVVGARTDGRTFIESALRSGASAIIGRADCATYVPEGTPWIEVDDPRAALGPLSACVHGEPARALRMVGVTGTNGKTTTTTLIHAMAMADGLGAGLVGTVEHRVGAEAIAAKHTTPEAPDLHRLFAQVRAAGGRVAVMEVSSIGLVERRVDGLDFDVAAFTNLTPDHLDHHGTMRAYGEAKATLFTQHLRAGAVAVINVDDPFGRDLAARSSTHAEVWETSVEDQGADVTFDSLMMSEAGLRGTVRTPRGTVEVESLLVGRFNASNVLIAVGCAFAAGMSPAAIRAGLRSARIRGRLERVGSPDARPVVLVDYAHTPDALERVLEALRASTSGRVVCVFGCGGDRDTSKRAPMGRAAAAADAVVLTSDNPRSESPEAIAHAALRGAIEAGRALVVGGSPAWGATWVELDRARAIHAAVALAGDADIVLVAGKGHETYQEVAGIRHPFDDVQVCADALATRGAAQ
jgi:UDP-N-acetylmuramoyl-L-alanyl-D-glutamate--2,6-diaminopimelate ligase